MKFNLQTTPASLLLELKPGTDKIICFIQVHRIKLINPGNFRFRYFQFLYRN